MEEQKATTVNIWTDGACSGNPGPGGWAFVMDVEDEDGQPIWGAGGVKESTNNQMELRAIGEALWEVKVGSTVVVHTDSKNCIGWLSQGWKRKVVEINSMCVAIEACIQSRELTVTYQYVAGHSGDRNNELVNRLAQGAIKR